MDFKKRFLNKAWDLSLVSAILILMQLILTPFNIKIDNNYIMMIVNAILGILTILGVFQNPLTDGYLDVTENTQIEQK